MTSLSIRNMYANLKKALAGSLLLVAAGCSGGTDTGSIHIHCAGGEAFCIVSCDLGCSQTGCSVTEVAENQRLRFTFSADLDPASINPSSVSIRTATGVPANGEIVVNKNVVTFVPGVTTVNGVSSFGFQRNESYIVSLAGGANASFSVRSTNGARLSYDFTCTVVASRGIIDENQLPPTVEMVSPTGGGTAPRDPTIILRFSELIDTTPLRGSLTAASPVRVTLRTATHGANGLLCNRDSQGLALEGIPRLSTQRNNGVDVTVVEFRPSVVLPGEACVEVAVTADLRDLSGRAAVPASFEFFTEAGTVVPIQITEPFANADKMDQLVSGGTWANGARPGLIGQDGRHGSFDYTLGTQVGSGVYQFDTTSVVIPATRSLTGLEYTVTDGKFYFTDFVVPNGVTVEFTGPVPPQIWVRGQALIDGAIKVNAAAMTNFNAVGVTATASPYIQGQAGGAPGAGGGRGGKGGDECQGTGPIISGGVVLTNGQNGEDVKLLAGHAYAVQAVGTGGQGSTMHPADGTNTTPTTAPYIANVYRAYFSPGGGGGGFAGPGGQASVTPLAGAILGTVRPGGVAFNLLPVPGSTTSLNHFLVGGSGGGGGATHAFGSIFVQANTYCAGSGGSGGGGACAIRSGGIMTVAGTASLQAKGGAGVIVSGRVNNTQNNTDWGISCPGGGGSGGSFLLQSGQDLVFGGSLDTSGGAGSRTGNIATTQVNIQSTAGAGSNGFYRLEAGGSVTFNGTGVPAFVAGTNSGALTDRDDFSGCMSLWYSTSQVFPPEWLRYELDVDTDGNGTVDITYTDSGAAGTQMAVDPLGPMTIKFQGARLLQSTGTPELGSEGQWRTGIGSGAGPGIGLDSPTGFRFSMTFNRQAFPNCVVRNLRVFARA